MQELIDGKPCGHSGCLSHISHPCEGCGRIAGRTVLELRPLEGKIETANEFEGSPDPLAYWTRGHVDKAEFAAEVVRYCAELKNIPDWWDSTPYAADDVEHVWYRNVPVGRDFPGRVLMYRCKGPGRGVYPVTEIDIDKSSRYRAYE